MKKDWSKLTIRLKDSAQLEILKAWLNVLDVDSIVEGEDYTEAYVVQSKAEGLKTSLETVETLVFDSIVVEKVVNQNWNKLWESQFDPSYINDLYIYADFHDPPAEGQRSILIRPKMAFGTGHHETTHMMIEHMDQVAFTDKQVLDYGCGTGLLSVFAAQLGAAKVDAIDIQAEAIENTIEHFEINGFSDFNYKALEGDLETVKDDKYDIILANINRHVLIERADDLFTILKDNGSLILSGILERDMKLIKKTYTKLGFKFEREIMRGEWCLFEFSKAEIVS